MSTTYLPRLPHDDDRRTGDDDRDRQTGDDRLDRGPDELEEDGQHPNAIELAWRTKWKMRRLRNRLPCSTTSFERLSHRAALKHRGQNALRTRDISVQRTKCLLEYLTVYPSTVPSTHEMLAREHDGNEAHFTTD